LTAAGGDEEPALLLLPATLAIALCRGVPLTPGGVLLAGREEGATTGGLVLTDEEVALAGGPLFGSLLLTFAPGTVMFCFRNFELIPLRFCACVESTFAPVVVPGVVVSVPPGLGAAVPCAGDEDDPPGACTHAGLDEGENDEDVLDAAVVGWLVGAVGSPPMVEVLTSFLFANNAGPWLFCDEAG
jgi:hypothetical protein